MKNLLVVPVDEEPNDEKPADPPPAEQQKIIVPDNGSYPAASEEKVALTLCFFSTSNIPIPMEVIVSRIQSRASNGDIILMLIGGINTPEAVDRVIPILKSMGYNLVTLTDLLDL